MTFKKTKNSLCALFASVAFVTAASSGALAATAPKAEKNSGAKQEEKILAYRETPEYVKAIKDARVEYEKFVARNNKEEKKALAACDKEFKGYKGEDCKDIAHAAFFQGKSLGAEVFFSTLEAIEDKFLTPYCAKDSNKQDDVCKERAQEERDLEDFNMENPNEVAPLKPSRDISI